MESPNLVNAAKKLKGDIIACQPSKPKYILSLFSSASLFIQAAISRLVYRADFLNRLGSRKALGVNGHIPVGVFVIFEQSDFFQRSEGSILRIRSPND